MLVSVKRSARRGQLGWYHGERVSASRPIVGGRFSFANVIASASGEAIPYFLQEIASAKNTWQRHEIWRLYA